MKFRLASLLLAASATTLAAQATGHGEGAHEQHQMMNHGIVKSATPLYQSIKRFVTAAAEQMPAEHYAFQPTPEVRTFGQLIGHVANASYLFCSGAMGEKSPATADIEKTMSQKAQLVEALKAAFAYCDKAYEMSDAKAIEEVEFFGQKGNRLWVLNFNVAHDFEHYGNIVTYMRMKGLTPPSSQRGQ